VRMTTVYLDDDRVRALLGSRRPEFCAALERVSGRVELGVRAHADAAALVPREDQAPEPPDRRSGAAYLLRRKRALEHQETAYGTAAAAAERIHAWLLQSAVDGKRKPVADNKLSGRTGWAVLNGTYLVDDARVDDFRALVGDLERSTPGIALEVTGPWPPYSFTGDVTGHD
jgi:Gas vesicle synthesis protein GvpL/GvpF